MAIVIESLDLTSLRLRVIVIVFVIESLDLTSLRLRVNVNSLVIEPLDLTSLRLRVIIIVFSSGDRRRIPRPHKPSAACGPHRAFGSSGDRQRIPRPHEPSAQVVIVIEYNEPFHYQGHYRG